MIKFLTYFHGFFLSLRYRVSFKGVNVMKSKNPKLFLPNHQASVDPQLLMAYLLKREKVAPLIGSSYYDIPVLKPFFKMMGSVRISDLERGERDANVLDNLSSAAIQALKSGKSILLYPGGQLSGQGYEKIFNKRSAFELVRELPDNVDIIGVRIRGLWGSRWSRAWEGKSPSFVKTFFSSVWYEVANLFIFTPKRNVSIEFEDITQQAKKIASFNDRKRFNNYLEEFYNIEGEEKAFYRKHYFFMPESKRQLPERIEGSVESRNEGNENYVKKPVPKSVQDDVISILAKELKLENEDINLDSNLVMDLNLDSIGLVTVVTEIESKYTNVVTPDINSIKTVRDICLMAMGKSIERVEEFKPSMLHISNEKDYNILPTRGKNILEHIIEGFTKNGDEYFAWDNVSGTSQRKTYFLKMAVVSKLMKKLVKGEKVGIMLPALQSTTLLVGAAYMAGKIPVMFNWTVGQKLLTYCVDVAEVEVIFTAGSIYEKVKDQIPQDVVKKLIFLEKEVAKLDLATKLKGAITAKLPNLLINKKISDTAVILFTSGSETNPKAVSLTHENVVNDLWGALHVIDIRHNSIFLSFLPPFHSFGFTVLTVLPLLTNFKIAYTPNPTAVKEVVNTIRHTRATNIMVTPTFLKMIMANASKYDLRSVELVISGAESLPLETKQKFEEMTGGKALIIEGYGITECAPIVCLNPLDSQKLNSVGKFIKDLDFRFVNPENNQVIPNGQEGMIVVSGKSVFNGYIDKSIESPFIDIEGKKFYKTGDLGYMDSDGFVFITGRLKRFIKIGGEMISMPMIERFISAKFGVEGEVSLAVEGDDKGGEPEICLFTINDMDLREVNKYLMTCGLSGLSKIHRIIKVTEIPILGSGKIDYRQLKSMIKAL